MMDLRSLCAALPTLCDLASRPDLAAALDNAIAAGSPVPPTLSTALAAHGLADTDVPWLALCRQCTAAELATVLTQCTFLPSPECVALLVTAQRRRDAQCLYATQLLWRLLGDETLPDALSLFGKE